MEDSEHISATQIIHIVTKVGSHRTMGFPFLAHDVFIHSGGLRTLSRLTTFSAPLGPVSSLKLRRPAKTSSSHVPASHYFSSSNAFKSVSTCLPLLSKSHFSQHQHKWVGARIFSFLRAVRLYPTGSSGNLACSKKKRNVEQLYVFCFPPLLPQKPCLLCHNITLFNHIFSIYVCVNLTPQCVIHASISATLRHKKCFIIILQLFKLILK